ncbi:MAG: S9 family peptidase, partial [Acidobacteriota bacterium]|nr:S9 family peptidase [Acidobacteriota bacterium]
MRIVCLSAVGAVLCLTSSLPAVAQRGGDGAGRVKNPGSVAISPDGATVAWSVGTREGSQLHLTAVANPDPAKDQIVAPNGATNCSNGSPIWSPDGQWLAYTSTCTGKEEKPAQAQIFLWSKATAESKQLTHVTGLYKQAAWSPDGKSIAFLFVENASRSAGALDAMKPWSGVIGEDGVEIQRVYDVDVADGKGEWLTPANLHVYEFDWAPDAKEIAFIAANPPGENTWWIAKLYAAATNTGQPSTPTVVFDPNTTKSAMHGLQIAVPRWSPDGKRIAFIGGLMSDQGSTGGDVWVVDAKGGAPTDITPGIDGSPTFIAWTGNDNIGFVEDRRGHTLLTDYVVSTDKQDASNDLGEVNVGGGPIKDAIGVSPHGTLALVKSGHATAPEVWAGPSDQLKQVTHLNDGAKPVGRTESIEWANDGFHVQGWLTYPKDYDPAKKYPMIVSVHGGPSASAGARWGGSNWANLGYFELSPNPRGSFGQGEKFTAANRKDFGYGDLRDIIAGVDAVEKKVSIDDHRLGMTGWSYGGFMSMFAATQTQRFRAIVAGAGLSDWLSYYGENSIDQWMIPFFGASVYDDPAVYAKSSAINFIKKAKTPMLIIVGDRDGECPAPQSFEMWHALRDQGVKTQLVV